MMEREIIAQTMRDSPVGVAVSGDGVVGRLSKSRQRKSLGETRRLQNERRLQNKQKQKSVSSAPARTTIIHPNQLEWPKMGEAEMKGLLELTRALVGVLGLGCKVPLRVIRGVEGKRERGEARREWIAGKLGSQQISSYITLRSSVALGLNSVVRSMGELVGLMIDRDVRPAGLTQLLIPIARANNVPVVALHGMSRAFQQVSNFTCIAIGFKKGCEDVSHYFYPLVKLVVGAEEEAEEGMNEVTRSEIVPGEDTAPTTSSLQPPSSSSSLQQPPSSSSSLQPPPSSSTVVMIAAAAVGKEGRKRRRRQQNKHQGFTPVKIRKNVM